MHTDLAGLGVSKGFYMLPDDRFAPPEPEEIQAAVGLRNAIEAFREIDHKMPISYIAAFLAVAIKPGLGPTDYAKILGTNQPIMSRLLLEIGIKSRSRDMAYKLVDRVTPDDNLRSQKYYLTDHGKILWKKIMKALMH